MPKIGMTPVEDLAWSGARLLWRGRSEGDGPPDCQIWYTRGCPWCDPGEPEKGLQPTVLFQIETATGYEGALLTERWLIQMLEAVRALPDEGHRE